MRRKKLRRAWLIDAYFLARLADHFLNCREIDPDSLEIMEKLGEGEFGVVHKAKW